MPPSGPLSSRRGVLHETLPSRGPDGVRLSVISPGPWRVGRAQGPGTALGDWVWVCQASRSPPGYIPAMPQCGKNAPSHPGPARRPHRRGRDRCRRERARRRPKGGPREPRRRERFSAVAAIRTRSSRRSPRRVSDAPTRRSRARCGAGSSSRARPPRSPGQQRPRHRIVKRAASTRMSRPDRLSGRAPWIAAAIAPSSSPATARPPTITAWPAA